VDVEPMTTRTFWPFRLLVPDSAAASVPAFSEEAAGAELEPPPTEHPIMPAAITAAVISARILFTDFFIFFLPYRLVDIYQVCSLYLYVFFKNTGNDTEHAPHFFWSLHILSFL
jgi:hypothetical protein